MKKVFGVLVLSYAIGCATSDQTVGDVALLQMPVREYGSRVLLRLNTGTVVRGELIAITDSSVWCLSQSVTEYGGRSVSAVELDTSFSRPWLLNLVLFMAVPSTILAVAAEGEAIGVVGLAATVLTYAGFETSMPQRIFTNPTSDQERTVLRHYARFPYGLPPGFAQAQQ